MYRSPGGKPATRLESNPYGGENRLISKLMKSLPYHALILSSTNAEESARISLWSHRHDVDAEGQPQLSETAVIESVTQLKQANWNIVTH